MPMHKITQYFQSDKPAVNHLILAVDVSSKRLDVYTRQYYNNHEFKLSDSFSNGLTAIAVNLYSQALALVYVNLSYVMIQAGVMRRN
jgi:hypothetical protein